MSGQTGTTVRAVLPQPGRVRAARPSAVRARRSAVGIAVAVLVWQLLTGSGVLDPTIFPTVPAFLRSAAGSWRTLLAATLGTLATWALGTAVGTVLGIVLGVLAGVSSLADSLSDLVVRALRPLPSVALIPVAVLVAGLGLLMTSSLVALATFWPVFVNTRYATRQVEPRLLDSGRAVGFGRWALVVRVVVPATAPAVVTGVRVAIGIGVVVAVAVQLVTASGGLGGYVLQAQVDGLVDRVWVGAVAGALLGYGLSALAALLASALMPWQGAMGRRT